MTDNIKEKEQEITLKSEYWIDDLEEALREQAKTNPNFFFKTQEKKIAIFLYARGYKIRGIERKMIKTAGVQNNKKILIFLFDNVVQRARLEYYNNNNQESYNINAKCILDAQQDITSMIVNF